MKKLMIKMYTHESMSPCIVLVLFLAKKYVTQRNCINYHENNNITLKYRYYILKFNDMLDEMMTNRYIHESMSP